MPGPDSTKPAATEPASAGSRRMIARRMSWGVADQSLSSLTNFLLGIAVARTATADEFGAYAITFTTFLVALNLGRAISFEPLLVRYSGRGDPHWRSGVPAALGATVVFGVLAFVVVAAIGLILGGGLGIQFLVLAVFLPGLLLQDAWRLAFFSAGRGGQAFLSDLIWTVTLLPALAVLLLLGDTGVPYILAAWGATGTIAALAGIAQSGILPRPRLARSWWRQHRDLLPPLLADTSSMLLGNLLTPYIVAAFAGLAAAGALRGAELLMGPFTVLFHGIELFVAPEAVRVARADAPRLPRICAAYSATVVTIAILWGIVVLLLPDSIGQALLGSNWEEARAVIPYMIFMLCTHMIVSGAILGLRAMGAANRRLRAGVVVASGRVAGASYGAATGGASGAVLWIGIANLVTAFVAWYQLGRAVREPGRHDTPALTVSP